MLVANLKPLYIWNTMATLMRPIKAETTVHDC